MSKLTIVDEKSSMAATRRSELVNGCLAADVAVPAAKLMAISDVCSEESC